MHSKENNDISNDAKDVNTSIPESTTSFFQEYKWPNLEAYPEQNNPFKATVFEKSEISTSKIIKKAYNNYYLKNSLLSKKNILFTEEYNKINLVYNSIIMYKGPKDFIFDQYLLSLNKRELLLSKIPKGKIKDFNGVYFSEKNLVKNNAEFMRNLNKSHNDSELSQEDKIKNNKIINHPVLYLNFDYVTCILIIRNDINFEFTIMVLSGTKTYHFKFHIMNNNNKIFKSLILLLQRNIIESKGYANNLLNISLIPNFYKTYFIKHLEFEERANTGDILIFKGFRMSSKCQRFFTGADYDHVALLIRKNNILYVYESTLEEGCKLMSWKEFVENIWNLLYDKMAYRELLIDVENALELKKIREKLQILCEQFVKKTENKNYFVSLKKILCGSKFKKDKKETDWENKEGFSCSSLVISSYIKMEIVPYLRNVDEILPGDFSQDSNMVFNKEYSLSPEYIINFN